MESQRSRSPTVIDDSIDEEQSVGTTLGQYFAEYMLFHALLWNMASYFTSDVPVFSRAEGE